MTTATATRSTKTAGTKTAKLHRHADGIIHALSSDGQTCYTVTLGAQPSCTCPAGRNARFCYHVQTALNRYGNASFFRPIRKVAVDDVSDLYN